MSFFKLKENNTNVRTEIIAGITTFMTMSYIIFVNPGILSDAGMPWEGVFMATIFGTILGTLCMAFFTNYPFALAPGMGLNAFFAYTVVIGMGVSWQVALGIVLLEGLLFILLSVLPVREALVNSIPMGLKAAISAGIGLFIAFIGLQNAGVIVADQATLVTLANLLPPQSWLPWPAWFNGVLQALKVKGALLLGILGATLIGMIPGLDVTPAYEGFVRMPKMTDWNKVLFHLNLKGHWM